VKSHNCPQQSKLKKNEAESDDKNEAISNCDCGGMCSARRRFHAGRFHAGKVLWGFARIFATIVDRRYTRRMELQVERRNLLRLIPPFAPFSAFGERFLFCEKPLPASPFARKFPPSLGSFGETSRLDKEHAERAD
jgi:hypothetical protein